MNDTQDTGKKKFGLRKIILIAVGAFVAYGLIGAFLFGRGGDSSSSNEGSTEPSEVETEASNEVSTADDEWASVTSLGLDDNTIISIYQEIEAGYAKSPSYSVEGELTEDDLAADDAYADQVLQEIGTKYGISADDANNVHGYVLFNYDDIAARNGSDIENIKLHQNDLLDVTSYGGNITIKAKIIVKSSNDLTRKSCYFDMYDAIKDYGLDNYLNLSFWAVADMTNGTEQKVISFDIPQDVMKKVADGSIEEGQLINYATDEWLSPAIQ